MGVFGCVDAGQVHAGTQGAVSGLSIAGTEDLRVPSHLESLFANSVPHCESDEEKVALAGFLSEFADVFSKDDLDIGRTSLVEHEIPILPDSRPISHAPRRLGPEKEADVEKQIADLQERGRIEPSTGRWSSPVVPR